MTTITNLHNLPQALVEAVRNDPYTGGGDISVTKLIDAPQRRVLSRAYQDAIESDVSERIWALLGQAVHHILDRAGTDVLTEERLFAEIGGWQLSGQLDRLHLGEANLQDYKVTTTYKAKGDPQWEAQLNCLAWLARQNGYMVERTEIVAIFRDWRKAEADRNPDYPQLPVQIIPVPLWTEEEMIAYITERVALHRREQDTPGSVPCTDTERWYSGNRWALMKPGGKRALRVLDEKPPAAEVPAGYEVIKRIGTYRRCESYCEVAPFCAQWSASQNVSLARRIVTSLSGVSHDDVATA
jgi:hypothetical protein